MRESGVYDSESKRELHSDALFRDSKGRVVAAPELGGAQVADTHCHLDMLAAPALALARAAANNVSLIIAVTDPTEDARCTYDELAGWQSEAASLLAGWAELSAGCEPTAAAPQVRVLCGCHPHNAKDYNAAEQTLLELAAHPLSCGIGEIGLDYHYDHSPRSTQREVFAKQLAIAKEKGLPAALHLREAHADGLDILREQAPFPAGLLLHCYNLGPATLQPFLELGCMVAFGGPVTFKKSDDVRESARITPAERLLTETDAPFMTPHPLRGTVCGPEHTVYTAALIAAERSTAGESQSDTLNTMFNNAKRFFNLVGA